MSNKHSQVHPEDNTLSRIGTSCLQQFLELNAKKFTPVLWEKVISTFSRLFRTTTPHQLFDESLRADLSDAPSGNGHANGDAEEKMTHEDRQRVFAQIIFKCILQLLLIETTTDLLRNEDFYATIPSDQLLKLLGVLNHSYAFAHEFNEDKDLRTGLWKVGEYMIISPSVVGSTENSSRIHEASAELAEAGDDQRQYRRAQPPADVSRPAARISSRPRTGHRAPAPPRARNPRYLHQASPRSIREKCHHMEPSRR